MSGKIECQSKCNVNRNKMSLKVECHSVTENGMSLKMQCHSKFNFTENAMSHSLKIECHSK